MKHRVSLPVSSTRRRKGWVSACSWVLKLDSQPPTDCQAVLELELLWPRRRPSSLSSKTLQSWIEVGHCAWAHMKMTTCEKKWDKRVWYRPPVLSATVVVLKAFQLQWKFILLYKKLSRHCVSACHSVSCPLFILYPLFLFHLWSTLCIFCPNVK